MPSPCLILSSGWDDRTGPLGLAPCSPFYSRELWEQSHIVNLLPCKRPTWKPVHASQCHSSYNSTSGLTPEPSPRQAWALALSTPPPGCVPLEHSPITSSKGLCPQLTQLWPSRSQPLGCSLEQLGRGAGPGSCWHKVSVHIVFSSPVSPRVLKPAHMLFLGEMSPLSSEGLILDWTR